MPRDKVTHNETIRQYVDVIFGLIDAGLSKEIGVIIAFIEELNKSVATLTNNEYHISEDLRITISIYRRVLFKMLLKTCAEKRLKLKQPNTDKVSHFFTLQDLKREYAENNR